MKVNFKAVKCIINFEGTEATFDVAKKVANLMMFDGARILDIGFEDLAREIYYSEGEVDIPEMYAKYIWDVIVPSDLKASIKRSLKSLLDIKY